ncbi:MULTISPECIES: hypothetical protein [unclassified Microbacterium]|uniref:hypothetical protein n=1 Tax=unclassified Microbacterium TaxID=2609290 RepID=UPI0030163563
MLALVLAFAINAGSQCSAVERLAGLCSVTNTGTTVEVGATRPGGGTDGTDATDATDDAPPADPLLRTPAGCGGLRGEGCYSVEVVREPAMSDLASFAPAPLALGDEPGGVGLVGMPVNFVVDAHGHEQTGTLFDLPVAVRFTPEAVLFSYGDGATRTAADGGRSWGELGLASFSATSTSHAYSARGSYTASAAVRYSASVDFGRGPVAVPGWLEIPTGTSEVRVFEVRTALVDRTCIEDPAASGC